MNYRFDVVVVGAGPAGIAAAVRAAEEGCRVALIDDNAHAGGQIWRESLGQAERGKVVGDAKVWLERLSGVSVERFLGWSIFDTPAAKTLRAAHGSEVADFEFKSLVIATGARERFLPFRGWTLPNVFGAGALQTLVKGGLPIKGKKIVIAGTGPLLIAVAAYMRQHDAEIVALCEQAPLGRVVRFGLNLWGRPAKLVDAMRYGWQIRGIKLRTSCWPVAALGDVRVERVVLNDGGKQTELEADYLACGFHLVPNCELALLLGCALEGQYVKVGRFQEASMPGIFSAGETTGIGGVDAALIEGEIAGLAAAGASDKAISLLRRRDAAKRFQGLLDRTYALNPALRGLASQETILCRCEDVTMESVRAHTLWRAAKLQTRVGMGACQGRVCGAACEFLFGWGMESVRPPIVPVSVANLIGDGTELV